MSHAIAAIKDGLTLRYCYNCERYEWTKEGLCRRCGRPIRDWMSKALYGESDGRSNDSHN